MPLTRKRTATLLAVVLALVLGLLGAPSSATVSASDKAWAAQLCKLLPHDELLRTYNGYRADRSGEIQLFATPPDFVGSGLPHVGPWDYVEQVPLLWYGPGYIKPGVVVKTPVSLADIADTQAALMHFPFHSTNGTTLTQALEPGYQTKAPPKLMITLVWDAGGMDVLNAWKNEWPNLKALIPQGTWFSDATVGTSPTSTAQDHTVIGTGDFPYVNSLVAHHFRIGQTMTTPWAYGPNLIITPTLGDLYSHDHPASKIGEVATVPIHLGMMGHGSFWGGNKKMIAILSNVPSQYNPVSLGQEGGTWGMPSYLNRWYTFPGYLKTSPSYKPSVQDPVYRNAIRTLDQQDGKLDGNWRALPIAQQLNGFDTPARIPYETAEIEKLITGSGFGKDSIPDMLFINYKIIDFVSHTESMNSPYMMDTVKWQDEALKQFIDFLDTHVGKGNYVLTLTADHGAMINPHVSGAYVMSPGKIASAINTKFGSGTVQYTQNTNVFLNVPLLTSKGYTVDDVAHYLQTLTLGQLYLTGYTPPANMMNTPAFQAAFPSRLIPDLTCVASAPLD
jgi:hypothetical protein